MPSIFTSAVSPWRHMLYPMVEGRQSGCLPEPFVSYPMGLLGQRAGTSSSEPKRAWQSRDVSGWIAIPAYSNTFGSPDLHYNPPPPCLIASLPFAHPLCQLTGTKMGR